MQHEYLLNIIINRNHDDKFNEDFIDIGFIATDIKIEGVEAFIEFGKQGKKFTSRSFGIPLIYAAKVGEALIEMANTKSPPTALIGDKDICRIIRGTIEKIQTES